MGKIKTCHLKRDIPSTQITELYENNDNNEKKSRGIHCWVVFKLTLLKIIVYRFSYCDVYV